MKLMVTVASIAFLLLVAAASGVIGTKLRRLNRAEHMLSIMQNPPTVIDSNRNGFQFIGSRILTPDSKHPYGQVEYTFQVIPLNSSGMTPVK